MSNASAVRAADHANRKIGAAQLELLLAILDVERDGAWLDDGARDLAHWVSMRYGISHWKACRWIGAVHAFGSMPSLAVALRDGMLSLDKVVELARFATPETIDGLTRWAEDVSTSVLRRRADVEVRRERDEALDVERTRTLEWGYFDEGRRFGMEVELPAADGAAVIEAIERLARSLPEMPDEEGLGFTGARRADALVALCTTVVVHARSTG
jgi:hypothetical protein